MVKKYCYGTVIQTGAIVTPIDTTTEPLDFFTTLSSVEKKNTTFTYLLSPETPIYGLGEQVRGINKRGWIYQNYCTDDPEHTEDKHSLYGAHNFFLVDADIKFGVFIDYAGKVIFDMGYTKRDNLTITIEGTDFDFYLFTNNTLLEIIQEFRKLIGTNYIPPKWAFGYQQSRWGYKTESDIKQVVNKHNMLGIPLDAVYLDIDYMDEFQDFTINKTTFPNFPNMVKEMIEEKIHIVPIIDAGVKINSNYSVYEEGKKEHHFCKNKDGTDFIGGAWPGLVHFPDFFQERTREWFGNYYKLLLDMGIDGFWNDMNEPALFYSKQGLETVYEKIQAFKLEPFHLNDFLELQPLIQTIANKEEDYHLFYHNIDGTQIPHKEVHNLYGYYMTKAAAQQIEKLEPEKRILLFSRSSYIGMHRYSGIWTGDNKSWWSHLLLHIKMMPSLNMCGFLYCGADIGGFGSDVTEELLLRWLAFGIFTPLMRNHCALGMREQEIYQFSSWKIMREIIKLRYRFLPYLYSEFMKATWNHTMYISTLALQYPQDCIAKEVEDQLLIGESIMIAPIYEENKTGRSVYLPEDMALLRFSSCIEWTTTLLTKGHHYIPQKEHEIVVFLRKEHLFIIGEGGTSTEQAFQPPYTIFGYITESALYQFYEDDGKTKEEQDTNYYSIMVESKNDSYKLTAPFQASFISCL